MRSRLGDDIDDFCVKCKRVMNHLVVSLLNDEPAKVRCRTCHGDHDFRHEQAPPPKIDSRKALLIQQALEKATAAGVAAPPAPLVDPAEVAALLATTAMTPVEEPVTEMASPAAAPAAARKNARAK